MRSLLAVVAVLAFGFGAAAGDAKKYTSKDRKFSATFPDTPTVDTKFANDIPMVSTIAEANKGGFAVIYSDMPADVIKAAPAAKLLEGGEKGLVKNFRAKVIKSDAVTFKSGDKKYPAREITAERDNLHLRIMIVLVGNRLYQVFVVGPKELTTSEEADEFFQSFEIKS